jgi:hypothetical protein
MKLGRNPRSFDPAVPHFALMKSMLKAQGIERPALLTKWNWADNLPGDVGMMDNDTLGDCTCAGRGHGIQVHTQDALGAMLTVSDACIQQMYSEITGYQPGNPATDQGANEQDVLKYLLNNGTPMDDGTRHKIISYFEVDPEHLDNVCEVIQEFGFAYIGFTVPQGLMQAGPPNLWDDVPEYSGQEGGHCVILTGFDRTTDSNNPTFNVISWGTKQWVMTASFFRKYVDEVYGLVDQFWIETSGKTPYNMALSDLEGLASALN